MRLKNLKRSESLRCTAGHTSFYFPTTRKVIFDGVSPIPVAPKKLRDGNHDLFEDESSGHNRNSVLNKEKDQPEEESSNNNNNSSILDEEEDRSEDESSDNNNNSSILDKEEDRAEDESSNNDHSSILDEEQDSSDDDGDQSVVTTQPATPDQNILIPSTSDKIQLRRLENKIIDLERKLENNKKLIQYYKGELNSRAGNQSTADLELDEAIIEVVNRLLTKHPRFCRYGKIRRERLVAKAVFNSRFALGMSLTYIIARAKLWLQKNVFTAQAVLKEMDLTGGTLNYEGINVLRNVEAKGKRYYRGSVLPSPTCLKRAAKIVERKADDICPIEEIQTQWGKGLKFCEARTVKLVSDSFDLTEKAKKERVSISESIDASRISSNLSCITAGFKVNDIAAVDPITKSPLCTDGLFSNVQSRNNVFPLKLLLAKETKESYDAFKSFFDFFSMAADKGISREGSPYYWEAISDFEEFEVV